VGSLGPGTISWTEWNSVIGHDVRRTAPHFMSVRESQPQRVAGFGRLSNSRRCLLADAGLDYGAVMKALHKLRRGTREVNRPCPETDKQRAVLKEQSARTRTEGGSQTDKEE
jgi:hypothetical protein